jgi:hypothetical protein
MGRPVISIVMGPLARDFSCVQVEFYCLLISAVLSSEIALVRLFDADGGKGEREGGAIQDAGSPG